MKAFGLLFQWYPMKFFTKILLRPLCFLILLGLSSLLIWEVCCVTKSFEHHVSYLSQELRNMTISEIEHVANLLIPLNSSASNLARTLGSSLNGTELSFDVIQSKVAPSLFLAFSTLPYVSHVSYYGLDGLVFSYFKVDDQTFALFSNTSSSSECYTQPVNRDTGKLYGQALMSSDMRSSMVNVSSFQESTNRTMGFSSIGREWNKGQERLFLNNAAMDGRGIISIGFPTKRIVDHFANLELYGGDLHLATCDGEVLVEKKLPDTIIDVNKCNVSVKSVAMAGYLKDVSVSHPCKMDNGELGQFHAMIKGMRHTFYCSILHIAGVESVYVLAFPSRGAWGFVHSDTIVALILLALIFIILVIAIGTFIVLIFRAARREMFLCSALVKQMESTQQAERKSMNKSLAFAGASHDVRASLAAITGLIELCHEEANPNSDLAANLTQINTCTKDLIGILNSVLDTSKIEAGKMLLEEEEFNLTQLLEDVVEMFYPLSAKKRLDIVLDHNEIMKYCLVRGDRGKLKQILCNLLSNAVKFTSEGHILVRAVARKKSVENEIIASNRNSFFCCLSRICRKNSRSFSSLDALHAVQQQPNCMEYIIDVDDTGIGIPNEKRKSVFENFVQVKETCPGQEGCGLGLGIVQSLVRLMGGEIKILDKENGEKGTCFQFNIVLVACHSVISDVENQSSYMHNESHSGDFYHHFGLSLRSLAPRTEGSHVLLLLACEERRKMCKRVIENLGVKVSIFKTSASLFNVVDNMKQKKEFVLNKCNSTYNECSSGTNNEFEPNLNASHYRKSSSKSSSSLILVVVDSRVEPASELRSKIANFRQDIHDCQWKFVLLDPFTRNDSIDPKEKSSTSFDFDCVLAKPFHGSHLYHVIRLLPEFGGSFQSKCSKVKSNEIELQDSCPTLTSTEVDNTDRYVSIKRTTAGKEGQCEEVMVHENDGLNGKTLLLVEDNKALRKLMTRRFQNFGAKVHTCENGKDAFQLVSKILKETKEGQSETPLFDYIFMDCQMPIMDGYEATRLIRNEEKAHGIHIPIIALTASSSQEEKIKSSEAGMDFHLTKPLEDDKLLKYIRHISIAQKYC